MQPARHALCSLFIALCVSLCLTAGARADGSSPSPSPSPSSSGLGGSGQSAPTGAGGGSMPIESTILAYQGLQYDADSIADAAAPSMDNGSRVIIATTDDISAILQLRIALTQTAVLGQRLDEVTYALKTLPCAQHPTHTKQLAGVTAAVTALSDIASLATTVASFTSVTESITSQSGSFLDSSLINLVASDLEYREPKRYIVYLPSVVPSSVNGINAFRICKLPIYSGRFAS